MKQKPNKITDAVLLRTVVVSVAGILLCMAGLVGTTWAWFTTQISSGPNTIQCASYSVQMTVTQNGTEVNTADALAPGDYQITLTGTYGDNGYCTWTVKVGGTTLTYYALTDIGFTLTVNDDAENVQISAAASWGAPPADAVPIPGTGLTVAGNTVVTTVESNQSEGSEESSQPEEETTVPTTEESETTEPTTEESETTEPTTEESEPSEGE